MACRRTVSTRSALLFLCRPTHTASFEENDYKYVAEPMVEAFNKQQWQQVTVRVASGTRRLGDGRVAWQSVKARPEEDLPEAHIC